MTIKEIVRQLERIKSSNIYMVEMDSDEQRAITVAIHILKGIYVSDTPMKTVITGRESPVIKQGGGRAGGGGESQRARLTVKKEVQAITTDRYFWANG